MITLTIKPSEYYYRIVKTYLLIHSIILLFQIQLMCINVLNQRRYGSLIKGPF